MAGFVLEPDGALARDLTATDLYLVREEDGAFTTRSGEIPAGNSDHQMYIDPSRGLFLWWNKGRWEPIKIKYLPVDQLVAGVADVDMGAIKNLVSSKGFIDELSTNELWTKLLNVAGNASIGGNLLAGTIRGKVLIGSRISTDEDGARVDIGSLPNSQVGITIFDSENVLRGFLGKAYNRSDLTLNTYHTNGANSIQISSNGISVYDSNNVGRFGVSYQNGFIANDESGTNAARFYSGGLEILDSSGVTNFRVTRNAALNMYGATQSNSNATIVLRDDGTGVDIVGADSSMSGAGLSLMRPSTGPLFRSLAIRSREASYAANVYVGTTGNLSRATSLRKAKIDIQDQQVNLDVLKVPFRSWVDKQDLIDTATGSKKRPQTRVVGNVAEEMERYAPELCVYDDDMALTGISYERIGSELIPIVRHLLNRIEVLEGNEPTIWPESPQYDDTELIEEITSYGVYNESYDNENPIVQPVDASESEGFALPESVGVAQS